VRNRLYLIAPVFNEAENLPRLFDAFREIRTQHGGRFDISIVLVDDGSTDGTGDLARDLGAELETTVLTHDRNRGPGWAFGTAFEHLATRVEPDDAVVTLEGDNTSRHELLRQMLYRAEEGHDAVFASPYMYGGGILHTTALRMMMSHMANLFVKELLGVHGLLTVSSFYRLYRGSALRRLQEAYGGRIVERRGYESMVELVMKMMYLELSISEVPMVLDTKRRAGKSKLKVGKTALGYLALFRGMRRWRRAAHASVTP
jgi:glycosyltransferase involved in cell wall biosynthesis